MPVDTERARTTVASLAAAGFGDLRPWTLRDQSWPLTAREREVAVAEARRATNRDVAASAGVSVRTVENQLQSVYRKLGLPGRQALTELLTTPQEAT